ncbi:MAG: hypothetical protein ACFFD4_40090 [Candidatus Odinarchaeota archaeon]
MFPSICPSTDNRSSDAFSLSRRAIVELLLFETVKSISSVLDHLSDDPDPIFLGLLAQVINGARSLKDYKDRVIRDSHSLSPKLVTWNYIREEVTKLSGHVNYAAVSIECPSCQANWVPARDVPIKCPECGFFPGGVND